MQGVPIKSVTVITAFVLLHCFLSCTPTFASEPVAPADTGTVIAQSEVRPTTESRDPAGPGTPVMGDVYVDQLIEDLAPDEDLEQEPGAADPFTRMYPGTLGITYRFYNDHTDDDGTLSEHGGELRLHQETLNFGSFDVWADGLWVDDRADHYEHGGRVLLRNQGLLLGEDLRLNTEAGHLRAFAPELIGRSYRYYLPSSLLEGLHTTLFHSNSSITLTAGEIGTLSGTAARRFETSSGRMQGVGLTHRLLDLWDVGFQFWDIQNAEQVPDHQSYAGVVQYQSAEQTMRHQFHVLTDSLGQSGGWYDGELQSGLWRHYAGLYYFQPDLLWTDVVIDTDRRGAYWRGDRRSFRWRWTMGAEFSQNNLEDDPSIAGYVSSTAFVNAIWRYRQKTQFGGSANINTQHADSGSASGDQYDYTIKGFVYHDLSVGPARWQAAMAGLDSPIDSESTVELLWDQGWEIPYIDRLHTDISYLRSDNDRDEFSFRIYANKYFDRGLRMNASWQYAYTQGTDINDNHSANFSIGAGWQFHPHWLVSVTADVNHTVTDTLGGGETSTDGDTVLLALSYNRPIGTRPLLYGRQTGSEGRGRIVGRVFLDADEDGRWDLNEAVLKDIVVYLDGRFSTETDQEGRFIFWPVATGEHYLGIGIEDAPLPWGLEDEAPQMVMVPLRGDLEFNFALQRLDQ